MRDNKPDFEKLMAFLTDWESNERSALGRVTSAGELADIQELERLFALPFKDPRDPGKNSR